MKDFWLTTYANSHTTTATKIMISEGVVSQSVLKIFHFCLLAHWFCLCMSPVCYFLCSLITELCCSPVTCMHSGWWPVSVRWATPQSFKDPELQAQIWFIFLTLLRFWMPRKQTCTFWGNKLLSWLKNGPMQKTEQGKENSSRNSESFLRIWKNGNMAAA